MHTLGLPTRVKRTLAVVGAVLCACLLFLRAPATFDPPPPPSTVALYDSAGYHDEVAGAFIYSLVRSGRTPDVYSTSPSLACPTLRTRWGADARLLRSTSPPVRDKGFRYGMGEIVQEFFPWPVKHAGKDKAEIKRRIVANELELVVFSTCARPVSQLALCPLHTTKVLTSASHR